MRIGGVAAALLVCLGCAAQEKGAPPPEEDVVAWEERSPAGQPLAGADGVIAKITAKVKKVDTVKRRVTLVGPTGEEVTVRAGEQVQRLNEIKAGDDVVLEYIESLAFEVRPPTKAEQADLLLATTRRDNVNLMVAQLAKTVLGVPRVIARVFDPQREESYRGLGVDTICSTIVAGQAFWARLSEAPKS